MAQFEKPNSLNTVWASVGEKIKPADDKIQTGWVVEIPPLQYENWSQHRQDQALAHINQHGVAVWDEYTPYIAGKSYVQGSDGLIYKAIINNSNSDPVTDRDSWVVAFVSADSPESVKLFNGYIVVSSDLNVSVNSRYYSQSSITLTLPHTAQIGDNIIVNKSPTAEVTINVESGGRIRTLIGLVDEVVYDILDEINVVWDGTHWQTS